MPKRPVPSRRKASRKPQQKKLVLRQDHLGLLYNVPFRDLAGLLAQAVPFGIKNATDFGHVAASPMGSDLAAELVSGKLDVQELTGLIAFKSEELAEAWFSREFAEGDPKKCFLVQGEGEEFASPDLAAAFVPV